MAIPRIYATRNDKWICWNWKIFKLIIIKIMETRNYSFSDRDLPWDKNKTCLPPLIQTRTKSVFPPLKCKRIQIKFKGRYVVLCIVYICLDYVRFKKYIYFTYESIPHWMLDFKYIQFIQLWYFVFIIFTLTKHYNLWWFKSLSISKQSICIIQTL